MLFSHNNMFGRGLINPLNAYKAAILSPSIWYGQLVIDGFENECATNTNTRFEGFNVTDSSTHLIIEPMATNAVNSTGSPYLLYAPRVNIIVTKPSGEIYYNNTDYLPDVKTIDISNPAVGNWVVYITPDGYAGTQPPEGPCLKLHASYK